MRFAVVPALACLCVLLAAGCADDSDDKPAAPSTDATAAPDPPSAQAPSSVTDPRPPPIPTAKPGRPPRANSPFVQGDQKRFDEGTAAFDAHKYKRAFKIFSELADNEDIAAMRNVAYMKRKGLGTDKDPEAAQALYEYVARAGLPTAQFDLAEMLLDGEAGDPDPQKGLAWLQVAARASHPLAQYRLGVIYEEGKLVPKDLFKAQLFYSAAAQHGSKAALERLSALKGWPKPDEKRVPGLQPLDSGPISPKSHP